MTQQRYKAAVAGGSYGRVAKAISLQDLDNALDAYLIDTLGGDGTDPQDLYRSVAYSFWCTRKRMNCIGRIPYLVYPIEIEDDEKDKDVEWGLDLRITLWVIEAWLTLIGEAFVLEHFERQQLDYLQVLNANTMKVKTWDNRGIPLTFEQQYRGQKRIFDADEMVYFRLWNPKRDIGRGVSSGQVGQKPGELVKHTNEFGADFFDHGAIPAVFLTTEGQVPPVERDRIRSVWNKMLQGVGNFFKTEVLTHGLKPTIVGQPIKDLAMPELSLESRMQILAAHDLPPGLAEPKMSLSERDKVEVQMWRSHIIPYCEVIIEPGLNEWLFNPLGLRVSFQYQELEAIQKDEALKSEGMAFTIGGVMLPAYDANVVSVDEVRSWIDSIGHAAGLPPLEEDFEPEERTPPPLLAAANDAEDKEPESEIVQNIQNRTQPKSAIPKATAPQWGRHHISLQS